MCDEVAKSNGGLCGECCPLPATATGLYKWLIWTGVFTVAAAVLSTAAMVSAPAAVEQISFENRSVYKLIPGGLSTSGTRLEKTTRVVKIDDEASDALAHLANVLSLASLICWCCIASIVCCRCCCCCCRRRHRVGAAVEEWVLPLKRGVTCTIVVAIVCQVLILLCAAFTMYVTSPSMVRMLFRDNDDSEEMKMLHSFRWLRLAPLVPMLCWAVAFFHVQNAAQRHAQQTFPAGQQVTDSEGVREGVTEKGVTEEGVTEGDPPTTGDISEKLVPTPLSVEMNNL